MIMIRQTPIFAIFFGIALLAVTGCRTSRQESRHGNDSRAGSPPALSRQMDSLLIIEQKLVEVIDSMTGLVEADHAKMRALEEEVHPLQNTTTPLPPNDPPSYPAHSSNEPYSPPSVSPPSSPAPNPFRVRYNSALELFNENDYDGALQAFQSLERDDPQGTYLSNYQYWQGECYYAERQYTTALQQFGKVLQDNPNSIKAAASQFKTGECYERMNVPTSARAAYERVIADYPNSEYRSRAQVRLKALRG